MVSNKKKLMLSLIFSSLWCIQIDASPVYEGPTDYFDGIEFNSYASTLWFDLENGQRQTLINCEDYYEYLELQTEAVASSEINMIDDFEGLRPGIFDCLAIEDIHALYPKDFDGHFYLKTPNQDYLLKTSQYLFLKALKIPLQESVSLPAADDAMNWLVLENPSEAAICEVKAQGTWTSTGVASGQCIYPDVSWVYEHSDIVQTSVSGKLQELNYRVSGGGQSSLTLNTTTVDGDCSWLNLVTNDNELTINGQAPETFFNTECTLRLTAAEGTSVESSRNLRITTPTISPSLSSDCKSQTKVSSIADFETCRVQTDYSSASLSVIASPYTECMDVYDFNADNGLLSLKSIPTKTETCTAYLRAKLNGVESKLYSISVTTQCLSDYSPDPEKGKCVKGGCRDGKYAVGSEWVEHVPSRRGDEKFTCEAGNIAKSLGLITCDPGYELKKSAINVDGEAIFLTQCVKILFIPPPIGMCKANETRIGSRCIKTCLLDGSCLPSSFPIDPGLPGNGGIGPLPPRGPIGPIGPIGPDPIGPIGPNPIGPIGPIGPRF